MLTYICLIVSIIFAEPLGRLFGYIIRHLIYFLYSLYSYFTVEDIYDNTSFSVIMKKTKESVEKKEKTKLSESSKASTFKSSEKKPLTFSLTKTGAQSASTSSSSSSALPKPDVKDVKNWLVLTAKGMRDEAEKREEEKKEKDEACDKLTEQIDDLLTDMDFAMKQRDEEMSKRKLERENADEDDDFDASNDAIRNRIKRLVTEKPEVVGKNAEDMKFLSSYAKKTKVAFEEVHKDKKRIYRDMLRQREDLERHYQRMIEKHNAEHALPIVTARELQCLEMDANHANILNSMKDATQAQRTMKIAEKFLAVTSFLSPEEAPELADAKPYIAEIELANIDPPPDCDAYYTYCIYADGDVADKKTGVVYFNLLTEVPTIWQKIHDTRVNRVERKSVLGLYMYGRLINNQDKIIRKFLLEKK